MEELFESKIIDELYEIRGEGLIKAYTDKYGEPTESKKAEKAENDLVKFMKKFIKDEKYMNELFNKINKFESCALNEMCFWHKPYYKLGFIDGIQLKQQIQEEKITQNNSKDSIIYKNINDILEVVEDEKYENLKQNEEYKKIASKIATIKDKYPRVRNFIENNEIISFTDEEMRAVLEIIDLHEDRAMYEAQEMFKIGLKEGKVL